MKKFIPYILALVLAAFGLITLFFSSSVLFDLFEIRAQKGNYVPFIVWANFISSWLYLAAAYGFIKRKKWTTILLGISSLILIVAFVGLKMHINAGGLYELETVKAMTTRTSITLIFTVLAYFTITRNKTL